MLNWIDERIAELIERINLIVVAIGLAACAAWMFTLFILPFLIIYKVWQNH